MRIINRHLFTILPLISIVLFATAADSQVKQNRIQNTLTGTDRCLDIINDGENNQLTMTRCGNLPGQRWSLTANQPNRKNYRLKTPLTGTDKCLDGSDGDNIQPTMAQCGNLAGQRWRLVPSKANPGYSGYYLLRNATAGGNNCLEIVNDGENDRLTMAQCSNNAAGQSWRVTQAP
jgi:Ricin-type beta-trefoil lectin domain